MSLCFYYQQIYNIMKYNLFDNFYEVKIGRAHV